MRKMKLEKVFKNLQTLNNVEKRLGMFQSDLYIEGLRYRDFICNLDNLDDFIENAVFHIDSNYMIYNCKYYAWEIK